MIKLCSELPFAANKSEHSLAPLSHASLSSLTAIRHRNQHLATNHDWQSRWHMIYIEACPKFNSSEVASRLSLNCNASPNVVTTSPWFSVIRHGRCWYEWWRSSSPIDAWCIPTGTTFSLSNTFNSTVTAGTPARRAPLFLPATPSSARHLSAQLPPSDEPDEIRVIWGTTVNLAETMKLFRDFLKGFKPKYRVCHDWELGLKTRAFTSPAEGEVILYETLGGCDRLVKLI